MRQPKMTVREFMYELGLPEEAYDNVLKYLKAEKIKGFQMGTRWYVYESEVERLEAEGGIKCSNRE